MRLSNDLYAGVVLLSAVAALGCNNEKPATAVAAGETSVAHISSAAVKHPNVVPSASVVESVPSESLESRPFCR